MSTRKLNRTLVQWNIGRFVAALLLGACLCAQRGGSAPAGPAARLSAVHALKIVDPSPNLRSLRVITWNIDHGEHLDRLTTELTAEPADLCLLQEVDWGTTRAEGADIGALMAKRLRLNLAYAAEFEELSQEANGPAFTGQATLTRLPIRRSRILRFEHQSGFWEPRGWLPSSLPLFQRRLGGRVALITELEYAGRPLVVYNAHLESRSYGRIQMAQLNEILSDFKGHYPADTSVLIAGDLNSKYLPSLFLHKLERESFRSVTGDQIERTHTIAMALDWIFVRGPFRIESGAVRRDWKGSDHYPVRAELIHTSHSAQMDRLGKR